MIAIRIVEDASDIDTYLEVRNRVHPDRPMPRDVVEEDMRRPGHISLIAELDGVPAGVASASSFEGAPDGELGMLAMRVPREHRRQGIGTALGRRCSEHARSLGKSGLWAGVRGDDADSLTYYATRGFDEVGRMQEVWLELAGAAVPPVAPEGFTIVPATPEHDEGIYAVAVEAEADIPAGEPLVPGSYEQWHQRNFGSRVLRELSFVALDRTRVVGYALLGAHTPETADHWMTGVSRAARGRGIALALKQAQIAAARKAGLVSLRTQNDLGNVPMRRINEQLGYLPSIEWVHLVGPLLL
jgi:GNAT superfamily N-acetyltransferase